MRILGLIIIFLFNVNLSFAQVIGGNIEWDCNADGTFTFRLILYRDCNDIQLPTNNQLDVWNHPSLTSISLTQVSTNDISPSCTKVPTGPDPILCGTGDNSGNGIGSIQKVIYESTNTTIPGVPPVDGFIFTWSAVNRSLNYTNIDHIGKGISLSAKMFNYKNTDLSTCFDSSPKFSLDPIFTFCSDANSFETLGTIDTDRDDSFVYSYSTPKDQIAIFSLPLSNYNLNFNNGYSQSSPLPDASFSSGNIPLNLNQDGYLNFQTKENGIYAIAQNIKSIRQNRHIAELEIEYPVFITNCTGTNTAPSINGPFISNSHEVTISTNTPLNVPIIYNDNETLQDGTTPQTITFSATGNQFGNGFSDLNTGCSETPCATLSNPPTLTSINNTSSDFDWTPSCDHLTSQSQDKSHLYYFKAQDDYCPYPGTSKAILKINVTNEQPLTSPVFSCYTISPNGDVNLTWNAIKDPKNIFNSYDLYSSDSPLGPFTFLANFTNLDDTVFTDISANANTKSKYYTIHTNSRCDGFTTQAIDTLGTLFLNHFDSQDSLTGIANLTWDDINLPPGDDYYIWKNTNNTGWNQINTTSFDTTSYADEVFDCSPSYTYQISTFNNENNCWNYSNEISGGFENTIPPKTPIIEAVSIDTSSGNIVVIWNQNTEPDAYGYSIRQKNINGDNIEFDSIFGPQNTQLIDNATHASNGSYGYAVSAFEVCKFYGNPDYYSGSPQSKMHYTIHLETSASNCERLINLNWNRYNSWNEGDKEYQILVSTNNGPFTLVNINSPQDSSYTFENFNPSNSYRFVIKAISNIGIESFSNISLTQINYPLTPNYVYASAASVETENQVEVRFLSDPIASVSGFKLFEVDNSTGNLTLLNTISDPNAFSISDFTNEANNRSISYQVQAIDECGYDATLSNIVSTIYLNANAISNSLINQLSWTPYKKWDKGTLSQEIFSGKNNSATTQFATVGITTISFTDDVWDEVSNTSEGDFCYRILARENTSRYGTNDTVWSNVSCAVQKPLVWVPNAFVIGGVSGDFKPVSSFIEQDNYLMIIYNRWAEKVFETSDPNQGWDGYHKGAPVSNGVYSYWIEFSTGNRERIEINGSLSVIR